MFQRHLSTFLLLIYSVFCLACLSWSVDPVVRTFQRTFFYLISPASVPVLSQMDRWGAFGQNMARLIRLDQNYRELELRWHKHLLDEKKLQALEEENKRLTAVLNLAPLPEYSFLVSRVLARDANDWFHSVLVQRGWRDGIEVSDPVLALQQGREVLVGQVIETFDRTCRVLLLTDPLSAVSARIARTEEEGAVEGQGNNRLVMNYLFSDSDVRVGDEVVTAGLGHVFPEGILLAYVESMEGETNESFKRALLKPALRLNKLDEVLVLGRNGERRPE